MKTKVDKELLPMKAHYFLFNAGTAPVVPFMPPLARQLGFSYTLIGTMYTILPIIGMLAKPLFGFIADRYHRHRILFLGGEILTAIAFLMIMFVPSIDQPPTTVQFHCHAGETELRYCNEYGNCVEKNLEEHFGNRTLKCDLNCDAKPFMWDIVCKDWLNDTGANCANNNTQTQLEFSTYVNMEHITEDEINKCLFFKVPKSQGYINNKNVTMFCPANKEYFKTNCTLDCHNMYFEAQMSESVSIKNSDALGMYQFWFFFSMLILSWIGMAVVVSIGDAICFAILGERHHMYGRQRLCGSLGFGIFSIVAGVLVDLVSEGTLSKNYTIAFCMSFIILGFDVLASTKLNHTQTHLSPNVLKDVGQMFLSMRVVIFFLWCILIGFGTALIWNFLFLYLESLGGCQSSMKTLEGFVMGIQCFGGELPFFFLSGWILKKIGHVNAMSLVLFGFGVRFLLYSMLQDPWYVLPIELLNGITFGIFYSTMASYASLVAPPGTEATMQGLVGAIFEGVGVSMGSLIGGMLFESVGGGHTFEIFGIAAFIAFIVHVCVQMYLQRNASGYEQDNGKVNSTDTSATVHMQQQDSIEANTIPADTKSSSAVNNSTNTNAKAKEANDDFTDVDLS